LGSSLTTTGSASGHSSGDSGGVSPIRKKKVFPPKVFECPVCHDRLNEKDFDRHIFAWTAKVDKTGVVRCDSCAGIRDVNHPLLQRYPHGTLAQRVSSVVTCIRSLLHPGAYDAMSAEGSDLCSSNFVRCIFVSLSTRCIYDNINGSRARWSDRSVTVLLVTRIDVWQCYLRFNK
jgi:hypothetical protein